MEVKELPSMWCHMINIGLQRENDKNFYSETIRINNYNQL